MKFIGIKWVKGYKNYNKPFLRVKSHPTVIFRDDKYYFFINLTTPEETSVRDLLRANGKPICFVAQNVKRFEKMFKNYAMNLMILVARVEIDDVTDFEKIGKTDIEIMSNYRCTNYYSLKNEILKAIADNLTTFYVYNGSDDDYQFKDFEDYSLQNLPLETRDCIRTEIKKQA